MTPSMSNIDTKHLALGSAAAAIVVNACDWVVNNYLLADRWRHVAQTHNIDPFKMNGMSALVTFVVVDCAIGFLLVWTYAAIRPRLGPGPGTATIASFVIFGTAALVTATFGGWFIPWDLYVRAAVLTFVSYTAGALAGAWVYKEEEA
jgi:hypothetical protein